MNQNLTLEISWASIDNSKLLIQLPDTSPAIEIIHLCNRNKEFKNINNSEKQEQTEQCLENENLPILVHNGRVLQLSLSLKFQNVNNNDSVIIYDKKKMSNPLTKFSNLPSYELDDDDEIGNDNQNQSLMLEALHHRDKYFQNLEMDRKALITYHQLFEAQQQTQQNWKQQLQNQLQQHPQQSIQFVFQLGDDSNELFLDIFGFGFNNNYTYTACQNRGIRPEQPTKIPKKKKEASVKPLPPLSRSAEDFFYDLDQYNDDIINCNQNQNKGNVVNSIENTQKYISEHSCNWKW